MGHSQLKKIELPEWEQWVLCAQNGDEEALGYLFEHTKTRLHRFCLFLTNQPGLAEDLCQDVFVYALENIKKLREPKAFHKWLLLIARNKLIDHKRRPKNKSWASLESPNMASCLTHSKDQELGIQIQKVLSQMTSEDRFALLLVHLEGYCYAEASDIVGISEGALKSRLFRARELFIELFSKT